LLLCASLALSHQLKLLITRDPLSDLMLTSMLRQQNNQHLKTVLIVKVMMTSQTSNSESHASTLMRLRKSSTTKWTCSQELLTHSTGLTFWTSPVNWRRTLVLPQSSAFTLTSYMTRPSPSQESEDTDSFRITWTCSSTSRTTSTLTSATPSWWRTSSELPTPSDPTSMVSTTMVSSPIQLPSIQRFKVLHHQPGPQSRCE